MGRFPDGPLAHRGTWPTCTAAVWPACGPTTTARNAWPMLTRRVLGARLRRPSGTEALRGRDLPEGGGTASCVVKGDTPGGTTTNRQGNRRLTGAASGKKERRRCAPLLGRRHDGGRCWCFVEHRRSALASSGAARDQQGGAALGLRGAVAARPDIEARWGAAALRTSAGEEARRRPVLALHDGSGGTPGSGSGSSAV
jgi:hypothetical protein